MDQDEGMPLPITRVSAEEQSRAEERFASAASDINNSLSTAVLFLNAVRGHDHDAEEVLRAVTFNRSVWGDFSGTRAMVGDLGIGDMPKQSEERPGELAYVALLDAGDETVRAFDSAVVPDAVVLTMVRPDPAGPWLVFSVSEGGGLPASKVFH